MLTIYNCNYGGLAYPETSSGELIYKAIDEDTDKYENEINEFNQKIEAIIAELTDRQ